MTSTIAADRRAARTRLEELQVERPGIRRSLETLEVELRIPPSDAFERGGDITVPSLALITRAEVIDNGIRVEIQGSTEYQRGMLATYEALSRETCWICGAAGRRMLDASGEVRVLCAGCGERTNAEPTEDAGWRWADSQGRPRPAPLDRMTGTLDGPGSSGRRIQRIFDARSAADDDKAARPMFVGEGRARLLRAACAGTWDSDGGNTWTPPGLHIDGGLVLGIAKSEEGTPRDRARGAAAMLSALSRMTCRGCGGPTPVNRDPRFRINGLCDACACTNGGTAWRNLPGPAGQQETYAEKAARAMSTPGPHREKMLEPTQFSAGGENAEPTENTRRALERAGRTALAAWPRPPDGKIADWIRGRTRAADRHQIAGAVLAEAGWNTIEAAIRDKSFSPRRIATVFRKTGLAQGPMARLLNRFARARS